LFKGVFLLYFNSFLVVPEITLIFTALQIAWPAAVSHSIVGEYLGYMSAFPSAIKQNFKELPFETTVIFVFGSSLLRILINFCVFLFKCDLLATTLMDPFSLLGVIVM